MLYLWLSPFVRVPVYLESYFIFVVHLSHIFKAYFRRGYQKQNLFKLWRQGWCFKTDTVVSFPNHLDYLSRSTSYLFATQDYVGFSHSTTDCLEFQPTFFHAPYNKFLLKFCWVDWRCFFLFCKIIFCYRFIFAGIALRNWHLNHNFCRTLNDNNKRTTRVYEIQDCFIINICYSNQAQPHTNCH